MIGLRARASIAVGGAGGAAAAGWLAAQYSWLALAVVGVITGALVSMLWAPVLTIAVMPSMWLGYRLPFAGGIVSVSDAFMYVGAVIAALLLDWRQTRLAALIAPFSVFAGTSLLTVMLAGTSFGLVEWGHRVVMLVAAVMIGALLRQRDRLELSVLLFLLVSVMIGLEAIRERLLSPNLPAYPFGIQKNYAGGLFGLSVLIALFWPGGFGISPRIRAAAALLFMVGLAASGSRGAAGSTIGVAVVLIALRQSRTGVRRLLLAASAGVLVYSGFAGYELGRREIALGAVHSPDAVRLIQTQLALATWQQSPIFGAGLLAYRNVGQIDPHNVLVLTLEESGVVGVIALAILLGGTALQLVRGGNELAWLAIAMMSARFLHGLVDVYWVHGTGPMPWLVVGAALAGPAIATATRRSGTVDSPELSPEAVPRIRPRSALPSGRPESG